MQDRFVFIMAGGSGERFWPMSRTRKPKHLLKLLGDRTLLEETARRLEGVVPLDQVLILTNAAQLDATREAVPFLPPENIVAEPAKRDTAPAAALATAIARSRHPAAKCILLPADAMIHDVDCLRRQLRDAIAAVEQHSALLTIAIRPTFPATGYGYLELGDELGIAPEGSHILKVNRFEEKPDQDTAEEYVESGRYGWNAGMFVWRAETFFAECERLTPPLAAFIREFPAGEFTTYLAERFPSLPKISVDYAVMEHALSVIAIRGDFDWDDVGTWIALPQHLGMDEHENTARGPTALLDAHNNIVVACKRTVALCGVSDLVIVETDDAVLVCHRNAVQKVKNLQPLLPNELR